MRRDRDRGGHTSLSAVASPHGSHHSSATRANKHSIIDLSSADSPKSLPVISISKEAPQRYVALRRSTIRRDWARTSAEIGVVEIGELITVIESRILTDSGQQRLRLDRGGWISAATVDGIALLQKVHEPQLAVGQSRSLTPPTSDDEDVGAGQGPASVDTCYADSELPYDPLAVTLTATVPVVSNLKGASPTMISPLLDDATFRGFGNETSSIVEQKKYQQHHPRDTHQQTMPGGGAGMNEIEQLRQQELTLYRQILVLSDDQVEALDPDAREQVCQTLWSPRKT